MEWGAKHSSWREKVYSPPEKARLDRKVGWRVETTSR